MDAFTAEQKKTFDTFDQYPWEADTVFQAGLDNILSNLPPTDTDKDIEDKDRQLLRAKHFFFSRFNQAFDLDQYLQYKQLGQQAGGNKDPKEARYQQLEQYDYDHDEKYLDGLSTVVQEWVNQQTQQGVIWDKTRLDEEFKKAQAQYYTRHVDTSVDMDDYFAWAQEKKEANQPACPFAHLWQNKGDGSKRTTASGSAGSDFIVVSQGRGATTLTLSSPSTRNVLTVSRLEALRKALEASEQSQETTAHMLNSLVTTSDEAVASSGLAYQETYDLAIQQKANAVASLEKLAKSYYQSVEQTILSLKKPCLVFMDGAIPTNASYLFLWHRFIRVVTEHAVLPLGLTLSHAPVPPLLLLTLCRSRKPNLPQGIELYLALAPPELVRLRGPELLKLGLADVFVPGAQFHNVLETVKKMSLCPPPATATAVQLGLATAHTYPGPDRLGVWENEIQRVFGAAESLEEIRTKLEGVNNHWSQSILDHWSTLPPTLLKAVFQAVKKSCSGMEPPHVFALEQSLNTQWRQSKDYTTWITKKEEKASWMEEEDAYPDHEQQQQEENQVIYEAPQTKDNTTMACPVTGQRSGAASGVCPVTGQGSEATTCPVTGQTSSIPSACPMSQQQQQQAMTCPVTGQKGAACPVSSQSS